MPDTIVDKVKVIEVKGIIENRLYSYSGSTHNLVGGRDKSSSHLANMDEGRKEGDECGKGQKGEPIQSVKLREETTSLRTDK